MIWDFSYSSSKSLLLAKTERVTLFSSYRLQWVALCKLWRTSTAKALCYGVVEGVHHLSAWAPELQWADSGRWCWGSAEVSGCAAAAAWSEDLWSWTSCRIEVHLGNKHKTKWQLHASFLFPFSLNFCTFHHAVLLQMRMSRNIQMLSNSSLVLVTFFQAQSKI